MGEHEDQGSGLQRCEGVDPLIGPDTVNTLLPETLDAYRDHGQPALRLEQELVLLLNCPPGCCSKVSIGRSLRCNLESEGAEKFVEPFDKLLNSLEQPSRLAAAAGA